jgi:FKBP-type peptidyl-prolyl cis-trans isomerase 2
MQKGSYVSDGKMIALRYCIRNMRDEVIEDIMCLPPVRYLHGGAGIHEDLQSAVDGMQEGGQRGFTIVPENATAPDQYFQVFVVIDEIRDPTEQESEAGNRHFSFSSPLCNDDCDCHT